MYRNRLKKVLLVFLFVEIIIITGICFFKNTKNEVYNNGNNHDNKMFAMYIEKTEGNYVQLLNPNDFPKNYLLNTEKSICKDNDGIRINDVSISYSKGEITIETDKNIYCSLYFDKRDADIIVNVSNLQSLSGYNKSITGSDGFASWDNLYNRLIISGVNKVQSTFNLSYEKDNNSYNKLKDTVENIGTSGSGSIINEGNAGYRYEGKNPNNYIWFNNEMWRIIGSIPVCLTASCGSSDTKLVKIIRNESIGGLSYDAKDELFTGIWGNNTIYKLLNGCYYGKKGTKSSDYDLNNLGVLCSSYCYGYGKKAIASCNYGVIGISSHENDYYGTMVESVYWNTGTSSYDLNASDTYTNEKVAQTIQGKVGLMSVSDYGYATSYGRNTLDQYDNINYTGSNWLYGQANEWTCIASTDSNDYTLYLHPSGNINKSSSEVSFQVRPVVYLNQNVYIISGTGTYSDPYQIGM